MPLKRKVTRVLLSEVIFPKPHNEAPLQTDEALDQEASDDIGNNTIPCHIPHTANPNFTKTFFGATSNPTQDARGNTAGFEGPTSLNIEKPP
jgi:hypothetical protein